MAAVDDVQDPGDPEGAARRLELIWGEGFLSSGGVAEVSRILGGRDVVGRDVLDIGSGAGGADVALVQEHGAGTRSSTYGTRSACSRRRSGSCVPAVCCS